MLLDTGRSVAMITHEADVANHADCRILLRDGQIVDNDTDAHLIGAQDKLRIRPDPVVLPR